MTIRTQLKAGGASLNHHEALQVRTALKAGRINMRGDNHNETLQVRSALKAGKLGCNHNETAREAMPPTISMRKQIRMTGNREDRLELMLVRAGLRAGRRFHGVRGRHR